MTVIDASVLADALRAGHTPAAQALAEAEAPLAAPELIDLEVVSAYRRMVSDNEITEGEAAELLIRLRRLPLDRHQHQRLVPRIWELRHQLTPYDAAYVALAEVLKAPLLTADRRLAHTHGARCEVRLVQ